MIKNLCDVSLLTICVTKLYIIQFSLFHVNFIHNTKVKLYNDKIFLQKVNY